MKSKPCKYCSTEFPTHSSFSTTVYCSSTCRNAYNAENKKVGNCKYCSTDFFANRNGQKFCSSPCRMQADAISIAKTCPQCHCDYRTRREVQVYCSKACVFEAEKERQLLKECVVCKKPFSVAPGRQLQQLCSRACLGIMQRKAILPRQCLTCLRTFTGKLNRPYKFCSRRCSSLHMLQNVSGRETGIEKAVAAMLLSLGVITVPQFRISRWVCDFYVPFNNLAIECDGHYWHSRPETIEKDKRKDVWLKAHGYNLLRLSEKEINNSPDLCLAKLRAAIW